MLSCIRYGSIFKKNSWLFIFSYNDDRFNLKALENAYYTQNPDEGLIFHSDLGTQYTSDEFVKTVQKFKMTHSFSYKDSPYDSACMESFLAILKKKEVNHVQYIDAKFAELALFKYIEGWYNRNRIHGSIGYKTPQEMENLHMRTV